MTGRVPRAFVDDLLNRVDIVEVIDARVPLRKKGREYWACCPFHGEKTPSFSVSPNKQFYHCFGCQQSGNAIGFLMDYDHMEFVEAIETLSQSLGLEVPYEQGRGPQKTQVADSLFDTLQACSQFYQQQLKDSQMAIDYLRQRGISGQTAKDFAIGYAPSGWRNIAGDQKLLVEGGMLIEKDNGQHYDRFRNRLMFPIRDRRGRTIAFGGRVFDAEDNPKYLNSPETPVFHKGEEIYGLYELRKAVPRIDRIFVTEGYMDVVALAEHGFKTAVATLGTAINNAQIEKLFRSCKTLIFCFDGDAAGKKAAWRSLEQCPASLKEGRLARFLFLPDGHDPDSFIREQGASAFEQEIEKSATLTEFLFKTLLTECNVKSAEGKSRFVDRLRPYFMQIPLQSLKDQILVEVEKQLSVPLDNRLMLSLGETGKAQPPRTIIPENRWTPVKLAINLLLQKPQLGLGVGAQHHLAEVSLAGVDLLMQILDIVQEEPDISSQNLLSRFDESNHKQHLYQLAAVQPAMESEENIDLMFSDCLQRIQNKYIGVRREQLIRKLQSGETLTDAEKREHKQLFTKRF
ncbi:MAG: DNA primase [Gammaproteobacteria bacterium]|nr:DNA primase [Gammaproteobacteria bacterium]